ncbi:unnamed protein product [Trichogramma brassicae]|uniref:Uncharacterized protein n=1 Tax=Trichogramma brassicae TaxID=86971 RepID=A0A6H5IFK7_9HYME|nr:unnamed protein product [Trichogramma brassicae]
MSVDVFGRVLSDKQERSRGVPGIGYKLTEDGLDFDIEDRRLCNVGTPSDARDAINFETLYFNINSISEANEKVKNKFEAQIVELERRISLLEAAAADESKKRSRRGVAQARAARATILGDGWTCADWMRRGRLIWSK